MTQCDINIKFTIKGGGAGIYDKNSFSFQRELCDRGVLSQNSHRSSFRTNYELPEFKAGAFITKVDAL